MTFLIKVDEKHICNVAFINVVINVIISNVTCIKFPSIVIISNDIKSVVLVLNRHQWMYTLVLASTTG